MQLRSRDALVICLEATGMSERQLARMAGLSHATVNHLITGRRTGCTLATAHAIETRARRRTRHAVRQRAGAGGGGTPVDDQSPN